MKTLQECQAEVFRRSEKRIQARRRRTVRTLAICVPLVLCLAGIPLLSGRFPGSTQEPLVTVQAMYAPGGQQVSYTCSIAKITVSGPDFSRTITEVSDILSVFNKILAYDTAATGAGVIAGGATDDESNEFICEYAQDISLGGDTAYSATACITVTLVMHDGTETAYTLSGSKLENLSTGQEYTLSQEDAHALAALLGYLP